METLSPGCAEPGLEIARQRSSTSYSNCQKRNMCIHMGCRTSASILLIFFSIYLCMRSYNGTFDHRAFILKTPVTHLKRYLGLGPPTYSSTAITMLSWTSNTGESSAFASQHAEDTHIVTPLEEDTGTGPASSPPSSSPVAVTPPDNTEEDIDLENYSYEPPFLRQLDDLLLAAAQEKQDATGDLTESRDDSNDSTGSLELSRTSGSEGATTLDCPVNLNRKRTRCGGSSPAHADDAPGSVYKKRKLSKAQPRITTRTSRQNPSASLSGAFRLQYARRPGSLRRAESLRSQLSVDKEEQVLNEVNFYDIRLLYVILMFE